MHNSWQWFFEERELPKSVIDKLPAEKKQSNSSGDEGDRKARRALLCREDEIYQRHFFLIKKNRFGKFDERFLMVSNKWLYNLKFSFHPTEIQEFIWAVPLQALLRIVIYIKSPRVASIIVDPAKQRFMSDVVHTGSKTLQKIKTSYKFVLRDPDTCIDFCYLLRLVHARLTGRVLPVEENEDKHINVAPFSTRNRFSYRRGPRMESKHSADEELQNLQPFDRTRGRAGSEVVNPFTSASLPHTHT